MSEPLGGLWYDWWKGLIFAYFTLGNSYRFTGRRNLPKTGPALLIANHESYIDPLLVGLAVPRHLAFLARANLFKGFFGRLLRSVNTYPVDQEGYARGGLTAMIDLLGRGWPVLIFPEGERAWDGVMRPFKPGVHLIIKKTMAPIVPCGIAGAHEALPRRREPPIPGHSPLFLPPGNSTIAVAVGKPLDGSRYAKMPREQALAELFHEVKKEQERAESLRRR
ncbi:MAG TPA: lysophospholipid acyltransferase family protein [Gemmataceae bacterium]|nr:lysophospholipid acyltransferase family protein [Gemmataceae bacterium]